MDSGDKIRSYYERKGEREAKSQVSYQIKQERFSIKYKILLQVAFSIIVVIAFNIFSNFSHINTFEKIISTTKNLLERNISLDEIENFVNAIKNFEPNIKIISGEENKISIDQELLDQINEEEYTTEKK